MLKYIVIIVVVMVILVIVVVMFYDGVYCQIVNVECGLVGVDGVVLEICDGIFFGVEMQCCMINFVNVIDMDVMFYNM